MLHFLSEAIRGGRFLSVMLTCLTLFSFLRWYWILSSASFCCCSWSGRSLCVCDSQAALCGPSACFCGFVCPPCSTHCQCISSIQIYAYTLVFLNASSDCQEMSSVDLWCKCVKDAHPQTHCCQTGLCPKNCFPESSSFHSTLEVDQNIGESSGSRDHEQWADADQWDCVDEEGSPV